MNGQRYLFMIWYRESPENKRECIELCDKLDAMFVPAWERLCEEKGWVYEEMPEAGEAGQKKGEERRSGDAEQAEETEQSEMTGTL